MGSSGHNYAPLRPCANCGEGQGYMGSSTWHRLSGACVCSRACGERLNAKITSGMVPDPARPWYEDRFDDLRVEIKIARNRALRPATPKEVEMADTMKVTGKETLTGTLTLPTGTLAVPVQPLNTNTIVFSTQGRDREVLRYKEGEGWTVPDGVPVSEAAREVFASLRQLWGKGYTAAQIREMVERVRADLGQKPLLNHSDARRYAWIGAINAMDRLLGEL